MHDLLREIDPVIAARLAPNDAQRIGRAIEVWRMTGQQLSSFQIQGKNQEKSNASKLRLCVVSLEPADRGWLHKQVEIRYSKMIQDGFLFEALNLFENQQLDAELSSMRCVGYRQAWALLENPLVFKELKAQALNRELTQSFLKSKEFEYFLSTSLAATRQLAKRQLTWLRSMPERHVIQCDDASGVKAWRDEVFPSHLLPMYRAYEP
jgi:tRNA dimethylallyltransferase